jgi:hypothetical protein
MKLFELLAIPAFRSSHLGDAMMLMADGVYHGHDTLR